MKEIGVDPMHSCLFLVIEGAVIGGMYFLGVQDLSTFTSYLDDIYLTAIYESVKGYFYSQTTVHIYISLMGPKANLTASADSLPWVVGVFLIQEWTTLREKYDQVPCDDENPEYHEAAKSSNKTGELTAIGEAITWIILPPPSTTSSYEICSDSTHAFDAIHLADPPISSSSNQDLIHWCLERFRAVRRQGQLLLILKVHEHCTEKSKGTRGKNRAETLAELGRRADHAHHLLSDLSYLPQSPVCTAVTELAGSLPCSPDTIAVPSTVPPSLD